MHGFTLNRVNRVNALCIVSLALHFVLNSISSSVLQFLLLLKLKFKFV